MANFCIAGLSGGLNQHFFFGNAGNECSFEPLGLFALTCPGFIAAGVLILRGTLYASGLAETVWRIHADGPRVELLLSRYVTHEDLHTDEKRRNCALVSSEFVHFISDLISSRLLRECRAAGLLEKNVYEERLA